MTERIFTSKLLLQKILWGIEQLKYILSPSFKI